VSVVRHVYLPTTPAFTIRNRSFIGPRSASRTDETGYYREFGNPTLQGRAVLQGQTIEKSIRPKLLFDDFARQFRDATVVGRMRA
jgi:hypothetical protein